MSQPWLALESLGDVATSFRSWRLLLADEFERHRGLLVPTRELAAALPVPGRPYEWLKICQIDEGVFEGYNEKTEEYVPVDRRDIVCYEFGFSKLADELAALIGFDVAFERLGGPMYRFRLGHYGNPNGSGFSLFLAKVSDPGRLDWCIDAFLAENRRPFVLFLTSRRILSNRNEALLDSRGCLVVPLEQALSRGDDHVWSLSPWARQQLVVFRDRLMPPVKIMVGRFPTPTGSRWCDLEMRFIDSEKINVNIRDQRQVLTYSQLGLVDSRSGKPSKQWELLKLFAREHGVMTWLSPGACRQNRKRRELLNKSLQQFFEIDGEPIELTDDRKGWRCVFKLQPEDWEHSFSSANQPNRQQDEW
jgi:hypothetical protein